MMEAIGAHHHPEVLLRHPDQALMDLALQRCRTAREAISFIDRILTQHGYASSGESISIADTEEVWLMEDKDRKDSWIYNLEMNVWVCIVKDPGKKHCCLYCISKDIFSD